METNPPVKKGKYTLALLHTYERSLNLRKHLLTSLTETILAYSSVFAAALHTLHLNPLHLTTQDACSLAAHR